MSKQKQNGTGRNDSMGGLALKALTSANAKLVLNSRTTGDSLVIWRDGKVCRVPATEIDVPSNLAEVDFQN